MDPYPSRITVPTLRTLTPSWADPLALMYSCAFRIVGVTYVADTVSPAAPADPLRVALGFLLNNEGPNSVWFSPGDDPATHGIQAAAGGQLLWFDLFTYGPMVTAAWNYIAHTALAFRRYEVYRLPGS